MNFGPLSPTRSTRTITLLALACASWGVLVVVGRLAQIIASMIGGAL